MVVKNLYSAKEAQKILGIDNNRFHYLVRKGTIKKVAVPGSKQSMYPKADVDKLAAAMTTLIEQYQQETSSFEVATIEDMPEEYEMDVSLYGKKTATVEERIARLKKNPESDYVLKNEDQIVGHISFFPVKPEALEKFVAGKIADESLHEVILPYTPDTPLDILFLVMSVKAGFPPDTSKHFGSRLISGVLHVAKQLGERGIIIRSIHATSRTITGIRICQKLGMEQEPVPNETGRYHFSLEPQKSDFLLLEGYRKGLDEYEKTKHPVK